MQRVFAPQFHWNNIMSEKSFAVVSVSAAVVCGVFFYPDPVARPAVSAAPVSIQAPLAATVAPPTPSPMVKAAMPADAAALLPSKENLVPLASH
jgi:hypothetical protein